MPDAIHVDETERDQRFDIYLADRGVGHLDMQRVGTDALFTHTFIAPAYRGRGLGERLVAAALDAMRDRGVRVVPQCWFVRDYIDLHPEYTDLVA
jgi:predicted GNAT family acetyltransferase